MKGVKKYCTNIRSLICVIMNKNFFVGPLRGLFGSVSQHSYFILINRLLVSPNKVINIQQFRVIATLTEQKD